jgi:uncharacterized protein (DUF2252 family)
VDVGHRAVGIGSIGTRAYLALLFGNGDTDPRFLQVKEATVPAATWVEAYGDQTEADHAVLVKRSRAAGSKP